MSTSAAKVPLVAAVWGDRKDLYPKRMMYVLSLEALADATGTHLVLKKDQSRALRHVFEQSVATLPDGTRCDLPVARIISGTGEIGDGSGPDSTALKLFVSADVGNGAILSLECLGRITFNGGLQSLYAAGPGRVRGNAFIASRQHIDSPTYRWLNRHQLFGVGRVLYDRASSEMAFTFDFYVAA